MTGQSRHTQGVELQPHPDKIRHRGGKLILVNGEKWGEIRMEQKGSHGNRYRFVQDHGGTIQEPSYIDNNGLQKYQDVTVWSDKYEKRRNNFKGPLLPLEQRLIAKVDELIEQGLLRSPAIVKAENEKERENYRQELRERNEAQIEAFRKKADECLTAADPRTAIVDALLWAQSQ